MSAKRIPLAGVVGMALSLAACGGRPPHVASPSAAPAAAAADRTDAIFDTLMAGDVGAARKQIKALLKREPMNPSALLLKDSIERDAKDLLGPASYPYTVRPGDTVTGLAQRLLGNRLKAYQLLRYNELKAPAVLTPGQTLHIPGEPPRTEPLRIEPARRPAPSPTRPAAPAEKAKPAPVKPAANPAAARQARAAGLTALNQGNVGRAIALLRRAAALDPGNALIARDLARARRIAETVRARK